MTHRLRFVTATVLLLTLAAGGLSARSVTLTATENATLIGLETSMGGDGEFGLTLGAGYSIVGVLDLGLRFGADVVRADEAVTSDIGMFYGFAPLKQSDDIPVSGQIYGAWTFRSESSDFLRRNGLLHEARGYRLGVATMRDFLLGPGFAFRVGGLAEYRNYVSTTTVGFVTTGFTGVSDVDYDEYPLVERLAGFEYGGYVGIMMYMSGRFDFLAGVSVLTDPDPNRSLRVRPDLQVLITR